MKKVLSIVLAVILAFSVVTVAFAEPGGCDCGVTPVIFVHGFAGENIYNGSECLFPPSGDAIAKSVPDILLTLLNLAFRNYKGFGKHISSAVNTLMGGIACDENGNSLIKSAGIAPEPKPGDSHKTANYYFRGSIERPDGSGHFIFYYDWRLDPMEQAQKLHSFAAEIKELTGHDKISIVCHSEGNTVGAAYLALFGAKDIDKFVFLSPAFKGLSLIGQMFNKGVSVHGKSDELVEFLRGFLGSEGTGEAVVSVLAFLNKIGVLPKLIKDLGIALEKEFDTLYDNCFRPIFGTSPGVWTFVPDEYYAGAKENMFGAEKEKYAGLIAKIDNYHYNVQNKLETVLENAKKDGAAIVICAGYNISSIPITVEEEWQADMLIDTKYMSIGATCAPYGETLGDGYTQKNTGCGHNHLSNDGIIDASTCYLPENTWFFKNQHHNKFTDAYNEFLTWALLYDGQPTVTSNPDYPQFMINSDSGLVEVK